jgi:hypothetical protein
MIVMDAQVLAASLILLLLVTYQVAEDYVRAARARDTARTARLGARPHELRLVRYPSASGPCR